MSWNNSYEKGAVGVIIGGAFSILIGLFVISWIEIRRNFKNTKNNNGQNPQNDSQQSSDSNATATIDAYQPIYENHETILQYQKEKTPEDKLIESVENLKEISKDIKFYNERAETNNEEDQQNDLVELFNSKEKNVLDVEIKISGKTFKLPSENIYYDRIIDGAFILFEQKYKPIYEKQLVKLDKKLTKYDNIQPFKNNIVSLNNIGPIEASPIYNSFLSEGTTDFIATHMPVKDNLDQTERFLQMLCEKKIEFVISLGDKNGGAKNDIAELVGNNNGSFTLSQVKTENVKVNVNLTIKGKKLTIDDCFVKREFKITKNENGFQKTFTNFYFKDWVDKKLPNLLKFIGFIYHIFEEIENSKPVCVHCSAGVGRTGVTILLLQIMEKLNNNPNISEIDVSDMFLNLRKQRIYMVQTAKQYALCHLMSQIMKSKQIKYKGCELVEENNNVDKSESSVII